MRARNMKRVGGHQPGRPDTEGSPTHPNRDKALAVSSASLSRLSRLRRRIKAKPTATPIINAAVTGERREQVDGAACLGEGGGGMQGCQSPGERGKQEWHGCRVA